MEKFIKNLVKGAGKILLDGFHKSKSTRQKAGKWDPVTKYDLLSEKHIISRIKKKYPDHSILAEESGRIGKSDKMWIIDPLDGTRFFSREVPVFCVNIAYVEDNVIQSAALYIPALDELYFAQKGKGAKLNNKKIRVADTKSIKHAMCSLAPHSTKTSKKIQNKIRRIVTENYLWNDEKNIAGPISLCWVAAGRYDITLDIAAMPWDYAPGAFIAQEAGAMVTDYKGKEYKWNSKSVLAANPVLHKKFMKELNG